VQPKDMMIKNRSNTICRYHFSTTWWEIFTGEYTRGSLYWRNWFSCQAPVQWCEVL